MKEPLHTDPVIEEKEGARFVNETGKEICPTCRGCGFENPQVSDRVCPDCDDITPTP